MDVVTRASELRGKRATFPSPVGFVPTMGALHAGHGALIKRARAECASVIASVFVNPLQFGPKEDFTAYPRSFDGDREMLERLGIDLVFRPDVAEMYPHPLDVVVEPSGVAEDFEGARRPGHFRGVATVVLKLFHMIGPDRAYFGEKDAQQLAVIRRMVADLDLALEIVGCPTQREADGLALSSRNAYLSAEERRAAPHLNAALRVVVAELEKGSRDIPGAIAHARQLLAPLREDYLAVVRPEEFRPLEVAPRGAELLAIGAAFAGQTRLIDNVKVHPFGEGESDARKTR